MVYKYHTFVAVRILFYCHYIEQRSRSPLLTSPFDPRRMLLPLILTHLFSSILFVFATSTTPNNRIELFRRQSSIINSTPLGCHSVCNPVEYVLSECTSIDCLCTAGNGVALKVCLDCAVDYGFGSPSYSDLRLASQTVLTSFTRDCIAENMPIRMLFLNAVQPTRPINGSQTVTVVPSISSIVSKPTASGSSITGTRNTSGGGSNTAVGLWLPLSSFAGSIIAGWLMLW